MTRFFTAFFAATCLSWHPGLLAQQEEASFSKTTYTYKTVGELAMRTYGRPSRTIQPKLA